MDTRGCMHRRLFIKKTWLSAFSYAQSHISLGHSSGFLVPPQFSSLIAESELADFCVMYAIAKTRKLVFLKKTVHRVGEKQKTNEKPGRNPRQQKTKCFGWISAPKRTVHTAPGIIHKKSLMFEKKSNSEKSSFLSLTFVLPRSIYSKTVILRGKTFPDGRVRKRKILGKLVLCSTDFLQVS